MAVYSISNFIKPYLNTDKAIQIQNSYGQKVFTINVCNYQKSFLLDNLLVIASEDSTKEYRLEFASKTDAETAQSTFRSVVDVLGINCKDTSTTIITTVNSTPITYTQYKSLQASNSLSSLTWYDVSDTLNALNLGPVIRVFAKATNDYQPEGLVLSSGALVILNTIEDKVQRFELSAKKILALNNSRIIRDTTSSQILADNDSQLTVTTSNNIVVSNSSVATVINSNDVTINGNSNVTVENANNIFISGISQNLNATSLGFLLENVTIDKNTTIGKTGKTTTVVSTDIGLPIDSYLDTVNQEFSFSVDGVILDLILDNKIVQANATFKAKLLLDSGVNDCKINVRDKNNNILYTASDIHDDCWLIFEYNKTTQLFEFIRVDAPEITTHKVYQVTAGNGQIYFNLPYIPTVANKLEMFVNGQKILFGSGSTFTSPNTVTFLATDFTLSSGDEIEFKIY